LKVLITVTLWTVYCETGIRLQALFFVERRYVIGKGKKERAAQYGVMTEAALNTIPTLTERGYHG